MKRPINAYACMEQMKKMSVEYDAKTVQRCIEIVSNSPTVDTPTVDTEPHWIPCSERLPEKEVDVLCCRDNKTMAIMHFNPVLTTRYPKGFSLVKNAFSWRQDNVVAWMPLPKPYEGDKA